jgi:predicted AAA+ superfamily ATPase
MELLRLRKQNRWWDREDALDTDLHLRSVAEAPFRIIHHAERRINLMQDRLYILRGPRQVGKTTILKKLIKTLITLERVDPRSVFYFAFDIAGLKDAAEVKDAVSSYIAWARSLRHKKGRFWIFLDEVTYTPEWAVGIKAVYDFGILEGCTLLATGSSAIDLRRGGERLPGRRGMFANQNDIDVIPMSFRSLFSCLYPDVSIQTIDEFSPEDIFNRAQGASYFHDEIQSTFKKYLLAGGYPLSIIDLSTKGEITQGTYFTYQQAIMGDVTKLGKNEAILRELIGGILTKSAEPITWQILQQMTGIGSHNTVEDYVKSLEALFVLHLLHQVRHLGGTEISFRKRKKIYFVDPFQYHCLGGWSSGYSNYFDFAQKIIADPLRVSRLLEGVVAGHLAGHFPKIAFWRNRGEIDFICVSNGKVRMFAELKYQSRITSDDKKGLRKTKGGLLLTKDRLKIDETNHIYMVPVDLFLSVLPE